MVTIILCIIIRVVKTSGQNDEENNDDNAW